MKKQVAVILVVVIMLTGGSLVADLLEGRAYIQSGIQRGETEADIYNGVFVATTEDGEKQDVNITVYPRQLTVKECMELLEQAKKEFDAQYLGENLSADCVSYDLLFPAQFCEGMVTASYYSNAPEVIWEDGSVETEVLPQQGQLVTITVDFLCQGQQMEYTRHMNVVKPMLTEEQNKEEQLINRIREQELSSREEQVFHLPKELDGKSVSWRKKPETESFVFLLLGGVAIICVLQKEKQEQQKKKLQREKELAREYPQMVAQLSLLVGAGMTLTTAWERIVKRHLEQKLQQRKSHTLYAEEMLVTYREIKEGKGIRKAYERFGERLGLSSYRKLSALLVQNLDKGSKDLVRMLDIEAETAIEEQKRSIRKQGEEAGTKLLLPMLLLFLMILAVIMIPAMSSF